MDLIITILPVVTKDLPISPRFTPYVFLSRCKFSNLTTRQPMGEFYCSRTNRYDTVLNEMKNHSCDSLYKRYLLYCGPCTLDPFSAMFPLDDAQLYRYSPKLNILLPLPCRFYLRMRERTVPTYATKHIATTFW